MHSVRQQRQDRQGPGRKVPARTGAGADSCDSCEGAHARAECQYRRAVCHNCGRSGHLARVCRSKPATKKRSPQHAAAAAQTNQVQEDEQAETDAYPLYTLTTDRTKPVVVKLRVDGKELAMEVDTGAAVSLISGNTYHAHWAEGQAPALQHANMKLRTYTGEEIDVLGCVDVKVVYAGQQEHLRLLVVAGDGPSIDNYTGKGIGNGIT